MEADILNRADILQRTASPEDYRNILSDRRKRTNRASNLAFIMLTRKPGDTGMGALLKITFESKRSAAIKFVWKLVDYPKHLIYLHLKGFAMIALSL